MPAWDKALGVGLALLLSQAGPGSAQTSDLVSQNAFRVCADPANYPVSDDQERGYENRIAELFAEKHHSLFLGRGAQYPVAMEGALKLKEISYIHAEAYAAGELKHGPLALVDEDMPVVSVAPSDSLLEKLKSNLEEVRARGGQLINFACETIEQSADPEVSNIRLPWVEDCISPIIYTLPLQLLSYHVALVKGTDVDKPRNLAKSVTVE